MTDDTNGEWLTYAEAGERLAIKPESVKRRARSRNWPRKVGNDGLARVLIPTDRLKDADTDDREGGLAAVPAIAAPDAATLERAIRAEARADAAEAMLKEARDDRDRWREMAERLSHPEPSIIARLLGLGRGRRGRD